jgi:hypothetical protein
MPQVPVKNTLFRFNTLRTPQLYTDIKRERICVTHPNPTGEGYYANNISSPAQNEQQQVTDLLSRSTEFTAYNSIADLKRFWGENFYAFSNYLATNRQQIFDKKEAYTAIDKIFKDNNVGVVEHPAVSEVNANDKVEVPPNSFVLNSEIVINIWDNLFYQIITNKNPALREQLIQALVANYFVSKWDNQEWVNELALAVVVIPPAFYAIKDVNAFEKTTTNATPIVYKQQLKNISNTAIANNNIEAYEKAIADFKVAEKDWQKRNQAAYTTAKQAYDSSVKQVLAEAPKQTDSKTGKPLPVNVVLPEFEFTTLPQIDGNLLINIQTSSLAAKEGLLSLSSFAEVYDALNRKLNSQTAISFNNTVGSKQVLAVNNNLFEVSGRGSNGVLYSFYAQVLSTYSNMFKVLITVETGYNNPSALDVVYNMSYGGHSGTDGSFNQQSSGTSLILELYPNGGGTYLQGGATSFQLQGIRIVLSNGVKLTFTTTLTVPEGSNYGIMGVDYGDTGDDGNGGGNNTDPNFIPGYGIRRLGIADYRKVEQSVCCYVPGEVSHIENIMAKEYKERSTRRLRRSEDTTTTEKQTEKEKLTDTTSTDRYEMQQEVAEVINKDTSFSAGASSTFKLGNASFGVNANFATHTSQQQSNHQAVTQAKDITERALERVVQKVREERVVKIIEEFEEQNKHGFDNRNGDKNISGVYRWIDKIYKNQVYNYGKRLMYEFAIPQPAIFHEKAMEGIVANNTANVLQKPIDPRTADSNTLENHIQLTASNYQYWAAIYNAQVDAPPVRSYSIGKSFKFGFTNIDGSTIEATSDKDEIKIPEGYAAIKSQVTLSAIDDGDYTKSITVAVGDNLYTKWGAGYLTTYTDEQYLAPFSDVIPISYTNFNFWVGNINVNVVVEVLPEHVQQWQIKAFNTIIDAYQNKLDAYNVAIANTVSPSKPSNPGFYRQIENTILRKNCMEYLLPKNYLGQNFYDAASGLDSLKPSLTTAMDDYASKLKFLEQAFEWDILSYTFYPFYWGNKANWQHAYQQDVDDALFRSFLQAGFARAVVSVRPGFEQAVMYYMSTGKVWNGEQVPVIGDDLYLSIVDELKNQTFYVDETWETRVPTTLTVLQAKSIGLDAEGLPCSCGSDDSIKNSEATLGVHLPKEG